MLCHLKQMCVSSDNGISGSVEDDTFLVVWTFAPNQTGSGGVNTSHRRVRSTKQSCAFPVHIVSPQASQRGHHLLLTSPSKNRCIRSCVETRSVCFPPVLPQRQSMIGHKLGDRYRFFLRGKVHIHLKNINLFPSRVTSPKPHNLFFVQF